MEYNEIPDYEVYRTWKNAYGEWEVKLIDGVGETALHLSEDPDAPDDRIEDGLFYLWDTGAGLSWIREREAFTMEYDTGTVTDADYVELREDGKKHETQHNHVHLDNDVRNGRKIALSPV
ncbi:hypothetical protein HCTV-7_gp112 [Haloarcula phage HCTV-7]|uniref:Uncharacterized protein n=5 Tax=Haloferacalesvirus TaxID=2843389 RepID=A0AAE8XVB8_9CAUD|nr:hypothetical protein M194_gp012 [Halorubrum tailed phage 5]UBF20437.1 hypothetical protein HCTV-7_gp112 [Haloarcula phage HCTV-7]UBF20553.1 hypothetical protein HCTV-9_gp112 [Haloarcula phage HCTV-9]UBF20669.1 hypothetical protein HCTV-11_gp112 [Haloarcula phage HCTV-11]UBF21362.1 hypothetical protein HRTV-13_gp116 [Halorubrum phage HRTV-13]AGM11087.1 hypothetical protein HRTV5_117 [Halorubrum tailed phage 5]